MKKRRFGIVLLVMILAFVCVGTAVARKKGNIHYKAKCRECSCTEFVSDADSTYKCYNCGHADYMHKK